MTQPNEPLVGVGLKHRQKASERSAPDAQPAILDDATRARIRAEELERAKVREELAAEQRIQARPSYWGGLLLNLIVSGAGLMFIGRAGQGLAWLAGTLALAFLVSPWLAWPVGVLGSLYHYDSLYGQLFATAEEKQAEESAGRLTPWLIGFIVLSLGTFFIFFGPPR